MRFVTASLVAMALIWLGAIAVSTGSADRLIYDASREISTWPRSRPSQNFQTWSWVREDLAIAAERVPDNPTAHELLAMLDVRRTDSQEYLSEAVVHLRHALELRPTSPYTWVTLAEAKYLLGETDSDFERSLRMAVFLGPGEPDVQRRVVDLGLAVWDEVAPETRQAVDKALTWGMRRNAPEMLQISERRGKFALACRHGQVMGDRYPRWSQLCASTEAFQ